MKRQPTCQRLGAADELNVNECDVKKYERPVHMQFTPSRSDGQFTCSSTRLQGKLFRRSIKLLPALARRGAAPMDALAIAYNATFLFYNMPHSPLLFSPKQVLKRYSLAQIAAYCEDIINGVECGFNKNFKGDLQ